MNKLLSLRSLRDLFQIEIRALWCSERQMAVGLPFLAAHCCSNELQAVLKQRVGFAEKRSLLLAELVPGVDYDSDDMECAECAGISGLLNRGEMSPVLRNKRCQVTAVQAILDGAHQLIERFIESLMETQPQAMPAVLDAAIASVLLRIGHLNIADYGSVHAYASLLRRQDAIIFYQLLRGELTAEKELSRLIEVAINPRACEVGEAGLVLHSPL